MPQEPRAPPIEFRYYLHVFQLDHLSRGLQPIRMADGLMYAPPQLQYRYRSRITNGEGVRSEWSEWREVPYVREGDGEFQLGDIPITTETVRQ